MKPTGASSCLALASLLVTWPSWATDAGTATVTTASCHPHGVYTIPRQLYGQTPTEARAWRQQTGYAGELRPRVMRQPRTKPGRVHSTNPHAGARVCGDTTVWLNVGPPEPAELVAIDDLQGLDPGEALKRLAKSGIAMPGQVGFMACGRALTSLPAGCHDQFIVARQWPPAGTRVDSKAASIQLQLARHELQSAACGADAGLAWRHDVQRIHALPTSAPQGTTVTDWRPAGTVRDPLACTARDIALAAAWAEPARPAAPLAPAVLAGVLGGSLLVRLWPRSRAAAVPASARRPSETAARPPALRVRVDAPGHMS